MKYRVFAIVTMRALALVAAFLLGAGPATAQTVATNSARVTGTVVDQASGLPVPGAEVQAIGGGTELRATSTAQGAFAFAGVVPGLYQIVVTAPGYQGQRSGDVAVVAGSEASVSFVLTRARTNGEVKTIAVVTTSGGSAINSTATITKSLDTGLLAAQGYNRFVDALHTLPGVNFSGNLTAAAGDDASIDIRGLGPTETVLLLDGHPSGPQGVYPINGGGSFATSFNYSDSPFSALSRVQVTYGSGAAGLYGVDAIGGTIDMQTLSPTKEAHVSLAQGIGNEGTQSSSLTATGTIGRLGYALAGSTWGTYGLYAPQQVAQTAYPVGVPPFSTCPVQPNPDLTSCTLAYNTYQVTGDTTLRSGLVKMVYQLSNNTTLTGTWLGSGQWADSTGNGDADYLPYDTRLAQIQANNTSNCTAAGGAAGYLVSTNTNPNACYTAQQFAAATSGPDGGGPGRNRGTGMFDYDVAAHTVVGKSTYTLGYFLDHYKFFKDNTQSEGLTPDPATGLYPGNLYSQWTNTQGFIASDDIVNDKSEIGFGYMTDHEFETRLDQQDGVYNWTAPATYGYGSVFVRGNVELSPKLTAFGNVWGIKSGVTGQTNVDPRLSFVYRATGNDVFRVAYGHATGDPAAELKASGPPIVSGNPASLNAVCSPYNTIGQGGNPNIAAESSNDIELGYAHRFQADSNVQLNLYSTTVGNQLYSANVPVASFGGVVIDPILLQGYANKLSNCPGVNPASPNSALPYLSFQVPANLGRGLFQGVELTGRERLTHHVALDYAYDLQKASLEGIPVDVLQSNWALVPGGQVPLIPMHKSNLGLDFTQGPWEARIDGYYVGLNNPEERPAYTYFNGFLSRQLSSTYWLNLSVQNIFNQNTQTYGYIGHNTFIPENQYGTDTTSIQQFLSGNLGVTPELFGLASTTITLTLSAKL